MRCRRVEHQKGRDIRGFFDAKARYAAFGISHKVLLSSPPRSRRCSPHRRSRCARVRLVALLLAQNDAAGWCAGCGGGGATQHGGDRPAPPRRPTRSSSRAEKIFRQARRTERAAAMAYVRMSSRPSRGATQHGGRSSGALPLDKISLSCYSNCVCARTGARKSFQKDFGSIYFTRFLLCIT